MANFYKDNDDLRFMFKHLDIAMLAELSEEGFKFKDEFDPKNTDF